MVSVAHCVTVLCITLMCPICDAKTTTLEICAVRCTGNLQCTNENSSLNAIIYTPTSNTLPTSKFTIHEKVNFGHTSVHTVQHFVIKKHRTYFSPEFFPWQPSFHVVLSICRSTELLTGHIKHSTSTAAKTASTALLPW